jgi:hypothetical protein
VFGPLRENGTHSKNQHEARVSYRSAIGNGGRGVRNGAVPPLSDDEVIARAQMFDRMMQFSLDTITEQRETTRAIRKMTRMMFVFSLAVGVSIITSVGLSVLELRAIQSLHTRVVELEHRVFNERRSL